MESAVRVWYQSIAAKARSGQCRSSPLSLIKACSCYIWFTVFDLVVISLLFRCICIDVFEITVLLQPSLSKQLEKELRLFYKSRYVFQKKLLVWENILSLKSYSKRSILTEFRCFGFREERLSNLEGLKMGFYFKLTSSAMILRKLGIRFWNWFINPNWDCLVFLKTLKRYLRFRKLPLKEIRLKPIIGFPRKDFWKCRFRTFVFHVRVQRATVKWYPGEGVTGWYQSRDMFLRIQYYLWDTLIPAW